MSKAKTLKDDLEMLGAANANITQTISLLKLETLAAKNYVPFALANAFLMDRKHLDYGPKNIASFGTFGVIVRMNDKHERLKHLFSKKNKKVKNETIEDTLRDIANYAIIALMVERGEWPNE